MSVAAATTLPSSQPRTSHSPSQSSSASTPTPASASVSASVKAAHPPSPKAIKGKARGHPHTDESRRKIGLANRGNVPWNKGRPHSEETKRKIAENTRRAMLRPELREVLKQRALGRRHSEQTKLKIRHSARLLRAANGKATSSRSRQRKEPVPFVFDSVTVQNLNKRIHEQVEVQSPKEEGQLSLSPKRPMSDATKKKLSEKIKQMWDDPSYRSRVTSGIEAHMRKLQESKTCVPVEDIEDDFLDAKRRAAKKRVRSASKTRSSLSTLADSSLTSKALEERGEAYKPPSLIEEAEEEIRPTRRARGESEFLSMSNDALKGLTKEDLGIFGSHDEGVIPGFDDAGSEMNDSFNPNSGPSNGASGSGDVTSFSQKDNVHPSHTPQDSGGDHDGERDAALVRSGGSPFMSCDLDAVAIAGDDHPALGDDRGALGALEPMDGSFTAHLLREANCVEEKSEIGDTELGVQLSDKDNPVGDGDDCGDLGVNLMDDTERSVFPNSRGLAQPLGPITSAEIDAEVLASSALPAKIGDELGDGGVPEGGKGVSGHLELEREASDDERDAFESVLRTLDGF